LVIPLPSQGPCSRRVLDVGHQWRSGGSFDG